MGDEQIVFYMLTYFRRNPTDDFKPSGVVTQEAGTDRFEHKIDDLATAEVVNHYVKLIQGGECLIPQENPSLTPIASLRFNLANRDYSRFDSSCKIGDVYQCLGEITAKLEQKYETHVVKSVPHPKDNLID